MPTQLVHHTIDVSAQVSVACIETDAHFHRVHSSQNPKKVARVSKQKMGQFVFKDTTYAELPAALDYSI